MIISLNVCMNDLVSNNNVGTHTAHGWMLDERETHTRMSEEVGRT